MLIWAIIIILAVLWIAKHYFMTATKTFFKKDVPVDSKNEITEESVFKIQTNFEKRLQHTYLPDAIRGKELYIYRNLMSVWYAKLSAENRYNDTMTQKLRSDWSDYLSSLEDRNTYNYLSLESEEKEKQDSYRNDHITVSRKVFAIEDAFASAIGREAVDGLARIRGLDSFFDFDEKGNLAPEGFEFDLRGELRSKR